MLPAQHGLSRQVLEFLIEHQDHFLVGMQLVSDRPGLADLRAHFPLVLPAHRRPTHRVTPSALALLPLPRLRHHV